MNVHDAARIEHFYNPDSDIAVGPSGQLINVTWAEYALLQMIVDQQKELYAQQARIEQLERQVARLVEATPSAGVTEEYGVVDTYGGNVIVGRFPEEHLAKTFAATQDGFVVVNAPDWPGWGEVLKQRYAPSAGAVEERGQC